MRTDVLHVACGGPIPGDLGQQTTRTVDVASGAPWGPRAGQTRGTMARTLRTMASDASNDGHKAKPLGPKFDPSGFSCVGAIGFEPTTPTVSR